MKQRWIIFYAFLIFQMGCLLAKETFLLTNGATNEVVHVVGDLDERVSPYSTFKIALSLMGYNSGILQDREAPIWEFQEGYEDDFPMWKTSQNPLSWMKCSCVWYSKILGLQLERETLQNYLASFEYGNQDLSGGIPNPGPISPAWIGSSLKISPKEQVAFLRKMVQGQLPISQYALQMTKALIFREELANGFQLYGKIGGGDSSDGMEYGWFVGWLEKGELFFPFAYLICDQKIEYAQITPKVKQLIGKNSLSASPDLTWDLSSYNSSSGIPVFDNGEELIDLKNQKVIAYIDRPGDLYYTKMRKTVYTKLCQAQDMLPSGHCFLVYTAYRSLKNQRELFQEKMQKLKEQFPQMPEDEVFAEAAKMVSPLVKGVIPPHSTGGAVDLCLMSDHGEVLDMGAPLEKALELDPNILCTDSMLISDIARQNRHIMNTALQAAGFINYEREYWHWSYGDRRWAYYTHSPHAIYGSITD